MLRGIPAYCPTCKKVFEHTSIIGGPGNVSITFEDTGTNCLLCGGTAMVLDGEYQYAAGIVELLKGSNLTKTQVDALAKLRSQLLEKRTVTDDLLDALAAISPEMSAVAQLVKKNKMQAAILAGLLWFAIYLSTSGGVTLDFSRDTHITQVVAAPVTRIEDSVLYYPHNPEKKQGGGSPDGGAGSAKDKKNKR